MKRFWAVGLFAIMAVLAASPSPGQTQVDTDVVASDAEIVITISEQTQGQLRRGFFNYFEGCTFSPTASIGDTENFVHESYPDFLFTPWDFEPGDLLGAAVCSDRAKLGGNGVAVWVIGPGGGGIPADVYGPLLNQAIGRIDFGTPTLESSPDGLAIPFLTQLPVAFWPSDWNPSLTGNALIPGYEVVVTSTLRTTTEIRVDGELVGTCLGQPPDLSTTPDWVTTPCGHTFEFPTQPGESYRLSYEMTYDNVAQCFEAGIEVDCNAAPIPNIVVRMERNVIVAEVRGLRRG